MCRQWRGKVHSHVTELKDSKKICICLATDENYFPYCWNTICSIMMQAHEEQYEFIVLENHIAEGKKKLAQEQLKKWTNASIRFMDTTPFAEELPNTVRAYYSVVTYYRALLFSDLFEDYDKILYLDSDLVVRKNLAELYDTDISEYAGAVIKDYTMDAKMLFDIPIDYQGTRYNAQGYISEILGLDNFDSYFNAGVILFNLHKCRELWKYEDILDGFSKENYYLQDQDALNILMENHVLHLETGWNYQNVYSYLKEETSEEGKKLWQRVKNDDPGIIHYVSSVKPWNSDKCAMIEHYRCFEL